MVIFVYIESVTIVHGFATESTKQDVAVLKLVFFWSFAGVIKLNEEPSFVSKLGVTVKEIWESGTEDIEVNIFASPEFPVKAVINVTGTAAETDVIYLYIIGLAIWS